MKKIISYFLLVIFFLCTGCASYWGINRETQPSEDLRKYQAIYVGWLDLGVEKWQEYGFKTREKWAAVIDNFNREGIPAYLKKHMPGKKVTVAGSDGAAAPRDGLVIRFSNVNYLARTSSGAVIMFGAMAKKDALELTVHFIDGKTGRELNQVDISVISERTSSFTSMGFEGRVNNSVYNLVDYISGKVR